MSEDKSSEHAAAVQALLLQRRSATVAVEGKIAGQRLRQANTDRVVRWSREAEARIKATVDEGADIQRKLASLAEGTTGLVDLTQLVKDWGVHWERAIANLETLAHQLIDRLVMRLMPLLLRAEHVARTLEARTTALRSGVMFRSTETDRLEAGGGVPAALEEMERVTELVDSDDAAELEQVGQYAHVLFLRVTDLRLAMQSLANQCP
eukprot:Hpha_TRINITY_DN33572_c0_g1::TRINITY_DN33572_c0_g1_i1::g.171146::m.171146